MPPVSSHSPDPNLKPLADLIEMMYDKGMSYTNVMFGIGYAGIIAFWVGTHEKLSTKLAIVSALLAVVSILFYVAYEILQMLINAKVMFATKTVLRKTGNPAIAWQTYESESAKASKIIIPAWCTAFGIALLTGLGAAGVLVVAFIQRLLK